MCKNLERFALLESHVGCALLMAADGALLNLNPAGVRLLEAESVAAVQSRGFLSFVAEPDRHAFSALLQKVFSGEPGVLEFELAGLRGAVRQVEITASPLREDTGPVTAVLGIISDISQRKQNERDLLMLGQALNHASEAVFLMDDRLQFIYVNDAACASLGYRREELLGKRPPDIDPTITLEQSAEMTKELLAGTYYGPFESRHRTKDGDIFPVEITASVFKHGGTTFVLSFVSNISERKQRERQLALLDFALNHVREGAFLTDESGRLRYVNAEACRALECSRDELLEKSVLDIDPDFSPAIWSEHWSRLQSHGSETLTTHHRARSGRVFPVEVNANYFEYEGQGYNLALVRDITERKGMEESIAAREREFRTLVENTPDAIVRYDLQCRRIYFNPAFERGAALGGRAVGELLGRTPVEAPVGSAEVGQKNLEAIRYVLRQGTPLEFEIPVPDAVGMTHYCHCRFIPEFGGDGQVASVLNIIRDVTVEKVAQAEALREQERIRFIFDALPIGICLNQTCADGRVTRMINDAHLRIAGITREQDAEETWRAISHPDDREQQRAFGRQVRAGEIDRFSMDKRYVRPSGEVVWVIFSFQRRKLADGSIEDLTTVVDITERKRAETERLAHLRFLKCMDRINVAIQSANDPEQMMRDALDAVLAIFDCDRAFLVHPCDPDAASWSVPMERTKPEYPGASQSGLVLPMDPHVSAVLRAMLEAPGPVKFGPGTDHPFESEIAERFQIKSFIAMAIYPKVGKPWQFGLHQCSRERQWTPEEERLFQEIGRRLADGLSSLLIFRDLRENEARLAEAERVAHVGYWERDFDHERVSISDEARLILGLRPEEKIFDMSVWHQRWQQLIHPDDRGRAANAFAAAVKGKQPYEVEYRITRPDGEIRVVRSVGEASRDTAGRAQRIFGIVQDVTERRQLEEQLRQSQKMEAIGQLAGGVAHDFNNILTSILMQVELGAADAQELPDLAEGLAQIRKDAQRAANLTRQLLLFSRRQVMQTRCLDLNDVVTNLAKMLQRIIGEDVHLHLHLHPSALLVQADAGMLDQVLMNLAVNARDAMPRGGDLIVATSEQVVDENFAQKHPDAVAGRCACLSVSDTGCGIPPEVLPRIFEPFFTTKELGKGTGLGLATVFGIVKQHRGWLKVSSVPECGATFDVFLPFATETVTASGDTTRFPLPRGSETILLVEDEAAVRNATRAILMRHGYTVIEAANGVEALKIWEQQQSQIALLLTDLVMPAQITGLQLAQRLQKENSHLKVIFISGHSADIAGRQLELQPGDNFLQKPFSPAQLLKTIRSCLDT